MTIIDTSGNHHHGAGTPTGGQFAPKTNSAPTGTLDEPSDRHRLSASFDTVDEKVKAMQEELAAAVDSLADDEAWRGYLRTMSKFHHYSFSNQLLIAAQRPDATRVAGFKTWLGMKKPVARGEKGIAILAPRLVTAKDENGDPIFDAHGRPKKRVVGSTSATVFDIAQTTGDDLTGQREPTEEPPVGYIDDLTTALTAQGYTVEYANLGVDGGQGYTANGPGGKRVVVDNRLSPGTQATVLAHELGHIMCGHMDDARDGEYHTGHGGKRGEMEVEAESFAYALSRINGMETHTRNASKYVASWQRHEPDAIRKVGETLSKAIKQTMVGASWRTQSNESGSEQRQLHPPEIPSGQLWLPHLRMGMSISAV